MEKNLGAARGAIVAFFTALGAYLGWKGILLLAWVAVMALDYLSGTIAACKDGAWSSSIAREGLSHKGGMIFTVLVAAISDWVMVAVSQYIPLGIRWPGIILPLVLAWYIVTELGSILENAVKMGATVPGWLMKLLKTTVDKMDSLGENALEEDGQ